MKLVKSLALGSAAALMAVTGATAADLPGAEPVDYVKVCDIKGSTGFFYIPGTETCLQIGGFARLRSDLRRARPGRRPRQPDRLPRPRPRLV